MGPETRVPKEAQGIANLRTEEIAGLLGDQREEKVRGHGEKKNEYSKKRSREA